MKNKIVKITTFVISASLAFGASAFADTLNLIRQDGKLIYEGEAGKFLILNGYKDGKLKISTPLTEQDGVYWAEDIDEELDLSLGDVTNQEIYDVQISTPSPEETPKPEATPTPDTQYNPNVYPEEIYDSALDAYYAFGMVEKVSTIADDGGEELYEVEYACQGEMRTERVSGDVEIVSAPDAASYAIGQSAAILKRGDIIYPDRKINGEIKTLSLLYRPLEKDIVNSSIDYGQSFEQLFSDSGSVGGYTPWSVLKYGEKAKSGKGVIQYAFGVSAYKTGNTLYLINKSGDVDNAIEIDMKDKAAVYVCDFNSRVGVEIGSISAIGSNISKKEFNAGGKVSLEDGGYSYVLVRLIDGTATDIAYYQY